MTKQELPYMGLSVSKFSSKISSVSSLVSKGFYTTMNKAPVNKEMATIERERGVGIKIS